MMGKKKSIEKVAQKVTFEEGEEESLLYWTRLSVKERLMEAKKWNEKVWKQILKDKYPEKI